MPYNKRPSQNGYRQSCNYRGSVPIFRSKKWERILDRALRKDVLQRSQ